MGRSHASTSERFGRGSRPRRCAAVGKPTVEPLEVRRLLAEIVVTSAFDNQIDGDGLTTLREAVTQAVSDASADTIRFNLGAGLKTIDLTSDLPLLATTGTELHIQGPGAELLTVRAAGSGLAGAIFQVPQQTAVTISGLTIADNPQGGILNEGSLTVSSSVIRGNQHGGIDNHSDLIVNDSTITANSDVNGGGIFNADAATALINRSVISHNDAPFGGGIYNGIDSTLTVNDSNISNNEAVRTGGGIFNLSQSATGQFAVMFNRCTFVGNSSNRTGGAVANSGSLLLNQCTLSGNGADFSGGAVSTSGILETRDSLIAANHASYRGGGIANSGNLTVQNSTLTGNTAGEAGGALHNTMGIALLSFATITANRAVGQDLSDTHVPGEGGGILSHAQLELNHSIVSQNTTDLGPSDVIGAFTGGFNLIGGDPELGPLQDNGGPTKTMALLPGSPAINAGNPAFTPPPQFDQRGSGYSRVALGRVDIGAYELQAPRTRIESLIDRVRKLVEEDVINRGQGNALLNPLGHALERLARNPKQAIRQLSTFMRQLEARMKAIKPGEASASLAALRNEAQAIIDQLLAA